MRRCVHAAPAAPATPACLSDARLACLSHAKACPSGQITCLDASRTVPCSFPQAVKPTYPGMRPAPATHKQQDAKAYARGVVEMLRSLKVNRDMSVNECRLVVSIEDPRARERRDFDVEVRLPPPPPGPPPPPLCLPCEVCLCP